eukprot:scaffold1988_cov255-Pinguiococcus_pyrenoidosus.AAC.1
MARPTLPLCNWLTFMMLEPPRWMLNDEVLPARNGLAPARKTCDDAVASVPEPLLPRRKLLMDSTPTSVTVCPPGRRYADHSGGDIDGGGESSPLKFDWARGFPCGQACRPSARCTAPSAVEDSGSSSSFSAPGRAPRNAPGNRRAWGTTGSESFSCSARNCPDGIGSLESDDSRANGYCFDGEVITEAGPCGLVGPESGGGEGCGSEGASQAPLGPATCASCDSSWRASATPFVGKGMSTLVGPAVGSGVLDANMGGW